MTTSPTQGEHAQTEALDDLYLKLHGMSKRLESSGRIDESDAPEAYPAILDAMNLVRRLQCESAQVAAFTPAQPAERMPLWMQYDERNDVLTIHSKRYAAAMFGQDGFLAPVGTLLRVEAGDPDCVTLHKVTAAPGEQADPMDWPLPCDVTVGHGTMCKGVSLRTLVARMKVLYEMATGNNADEVANRPHDQNIALAEAFRASIAAAPAPAAQVDAPELDAWQCERCHGKGWHWQSEAVNHGKEIGIENVDLKTHCDACEGAGWCGPDAKRAALAQKEGKTPP